MPAKERDRVEAVGDEVRTDILHMRLGAIRDGARITRASLEAARLAIEQSRQATDRASDAISALETQSYALMQEVNVLIAKLAALKTH